MFTLVELVAVVVDLWIITVGHKGDLSTVHFAHHLL